MHEGPSGFTWTLCFPDRGATPMGARKPLARIETADSEPIFVPVCVARRLDGADGPEPGSRAELLYEVRTLSDECAWSKLVDLVSRRDYSQKEAADRLVREGFSRAARWSAALPRVS